MTFVPACHRASPPPGRRGKLAILRRGEGARTVHHTSQGRAGEAVRMIQAPCFSSNGSFSAQRCQKATRSSRAITARRKNPLDREFLIPDFSLRASSESGIKYLCGTARPGRFTSRTRTLHTMPGGVITSALTTADTVCSRRYGQVLHTDQPGAL